MTREEAKQVLIVKAGYGDFVENILEQIYNDHETQLKAKDEKIRKLNDAYANVVCDFESAVMEIERLRVEISQMKCCENCDFYPNTECGFNSQYGCLDGAVPSDWKLKRSKQ